MMARRGVGRWAGFILGIILTIFPPPPLLLLFTAPLFPLSPPPAARCYSVTPCTGDGMQAGNCNVTVEKLADYLKDNGY